MNFFYIQNKPELVAYRELLRGCIYASVIMAEILFLKSFIGSLFLLTALECCLLFRVATSGLAIIGLTGSGLIPRLIICVLLSAALMGALTCLLRSLFDSSSALIVILITCVVYVSGALTMALGTIGVNFPSKVKSFFAPDF